MTLLQLKIDDKLKKAIVAGNIFNAERDNKGKGIKIDDLIAAL